MTLSFKNLLRLLLLFALLTVLFSCGNKKIAFLKNGYGVYVDSDGSGILRCTPLSNDGVLIIPETVGKIPIRKIYYPLTTEDGRTVYDSVTKVVLSRNLKEIRFGMCPQLKEIDVGDCTADINCLIFSHEGALQKITVSTENARYIFKNGCLLDKNEKRLVLGLQGATIPEDLLSIGEGAFFRVTFPGSLILPDGLKTIENSAFDRCTFSTLILPESLQAIGEGAFWGADIHAVRLPNQLQKIPCFAFEACSTLKSLYIGSGLQEIEDFPFFYCSSLAEIKVAAENPYFYAKENCLIERETDRLVVAPCTGRIADGIKVIGRYSILEEGTISNVERIVLPDSVERIETNAIGYYDGVLSDLYIPASVAEIEDCGVRIPVIYCEATEKPVGWSENWYAGNATILWGRSLEEFISR